MSGGSKAETMMVTVTPLPPGRESGRFHVESTSEGWDVCPWSTGQACLVPSIMTAIGQEPKTWAPGPLSRAYSGRREMSSKGEKCNEKGTMMILLASSPWFQSYQRQILFLCPVWWASHWVPSFDSDSGSPVILKQGILVTTLLLRAVARFSLRGGNTIYHTTSTNKNSQIT